LPIGFSGYLQNYLRSGGSVEVSSKILFAKDDRMALEQGSEAHKKKQESDFEISGSDGSLSKVEKGHAQKPDLPKRRGKKSG